MKKLRGFLVAVLMLMVVGTTNAQVYDFSILLKSDDVNVDIEPAFYALPVTASKTIIVQIVDIIDIDNITMFSTPSPDTYNVITDPTEWWIDGKFYFLTTNDENPIVVNLSEFVGGYYNTPITNVFAITFMYQENIPYSHNRHFEFNVNKSNLVAGDIVADLQNTIGVLEDSVITLNETIDGLENTVTDLQNTNADLEQEVTTLNQLLVDTVNYFTDTAYTNQFYNEGYADGFQAGLDSCDQTSIIPPVNSTNNEVNVYPNPVSTSGKLYIQTQNFSHAEVYTTTGALMMTEYNQELDAARLTTGLYLVRVYDNQGRVATRKIQVK